MKNDSKEDQNAVKPADGGDGGQQNRRRQNRCGARHWNNAAGGGGSLGQAAAKYPTRNKELPENLVFDNTGYNDAANFQRSLKGLANHLHTTYSAEVADAILKMQAVSIDVEDQPPIKTDPNTNLPVPLASWEEYKWRQEYTKQSKKLKLYNNSMPKAYILLYNQCSTNLKNDLEASTAFPHVETSKDAIGLLKLIQGLCCSYDSKTQSVMATVASQKKLFTFFQRDGMDNSSYHREFVAHVETIETYGGMGAIGITPTFVAQKLQEMHAKKLCNDPAKPTDMELTAAHKHVHDEFLAALMLSGANRDRYGALRNELANQFGFGNDLYPKSTDQCLTMMNRRLDGAPRQSRAPRQPQGEQPVKAEQEVLVFAQGADKKTSGKPQPNDSSSKSSSSSSSFSRGNKTPTIICRNCGKQGHVSAVCPTKKPPEQIHARRREHSHPCTGGRLHSCSTFHASYCASSHLC